MLAGEVDLGKAVLRDYINATIGFKVLGGCATSGLAILPAPHDRPCMGRAVGPPSARAVPGLRHG